jgi:hypothetical protein
MNGGAGTTLERAERYRTGFQGQQPVRGCPSGAAAGGCIGTSIALCCWSDLAEISGPGQPPERRMSGLPSTAAPAAFPGH